MTAATEFATAVLPGLTLLVLTVVVGPVVAALFLIRMVDKAVSSV